jgi:type VI secretion system secreted protein Hcp
MRAPHFYPDSVSVDRENGIRNTGFAAAAVPICRSIRRLLTFSQRRITMKFFLSVLALASALWASPAWTAVSNYLKIDTIDGESVAKGFEKSIEVFDWSWGVTNSSSPIGGGGGAGKAVFEDFSWVQGVDKSIVPIFQGVAKGTHFKTATLDVVKAGGVSVPQAFFEMIFSNVMLTELHANGGAEIPDAQAALNYSGVTLRYRAQDAKGGFGPWIEGTFNLAQNSPASFSGDPGVVLGLFEAGGNVRLDAFPSVSAVPEPQTWTMLLVGLTLVSGALARKRIQF